ncbi:MAG TPA: glycosyltransferase family 4 protein [Candidatus Didemnitutus sp.]|nr:glycosyltransferase family 4 protein [Candidatus Didemnitutus sp.]
MKLAVLAQTPPPLHGQSVMVRALIDGLSRESIEIIPIEFRLSRSAADIGSWRPGKMVAVLEACFQAVAARLAGADTLYYVPAPGKRGALYRDWLVMLLCRPFYRRLILHWHATGLDEWLENQATALERAITRRLLGNADFAIVLTPQLRSGAESLRAKKIAVVANGVPDPGVMTREAGNDFNVLFVGLCSEQKGLFDAIDAVVAANDSTPTRPFRLVAAGSFPDRATERRFADLAAKHGNQIRHAGFATGDAKRRLFTNARCLCLPSRLAHEGQPLVLLEALAAGLPIVATNWRGIPDTVPSQCGRLVALGNVPALAAALVDIRAHPPAPGIARAHYLAHFTLEQHLQALAEAIESVM